MNSKLHYIRAIKGGSIKIEVNVVANGKSKLKFKPLVDVYNRGDTGDEVPMVSRAVRDLEMAQDSCTFGAEVDARSDRSLIFILLRRLMNIQFSWIK